VATATGKLTFEQFQAQYEHGDQAYEFWYGEAIPKGMPTVIHGLLQSIIARLLSEAGFISASDVELRIEPEAHPRPDVIARKAKLSVALYPTDGWDVVVEIVSESDSYPVVREKCRKYQAWGFGAIFLVDPSDRSVVEWKDGALIPSAKLASIPVQRIWNLLDEQYSA
jgi:Uma2 family endonuclease